jgi:hypothetical protein
MNGIMGTLAFFYPLFKFGIYVIFLWSFAYGLFFFCFRSTFEAGPFWFGAVILISCNAALLRFLWKLEQHYRQRQQRRAAK